MRISDWSSDVCSSDLDVQDEVAASIRARRFADVVEIVLARLVLDRQPIAFLGCVSGRQAAKVDRGARLVRAVHDRASRRSLWHVNQRVGDAQPFALRSEEHTSELQSLMRISYAVF